MNFNDPTSRAIIIGVLVVLFALPKPSIATIMSWLTKLKPSGSYSFSLKQFIIPAVSIALLLMPTTPVPSPTPEPVPVVQKDALDTATDVYRELMYDAWTDFSVKKPTFKNDVEALDFINKRQVDAYKAAYAPVNDRAASEAGVGGDPAKFANDFKNRSL
jgi:hypothetical protein